MYLPDDSVIANRTKVNSYLQELLGVDREQFSQISMLAQGEFKELLVAESGDRQKIFSKLFTHQGILFCRSVFRMRRESFRVNGTI